MLTGGTQHTKNATRRAGALAVATVMAVVGLFRAAPAFAHGDIRIPAGTPVVISLVTEVRSTTAQPGDDVRATITTPLVVNGEAVIPADSTLVGRVENVVSAPAVGPQSGVRLRFDRITSPAGASIDVVGDLTTLAGTTLTAVDNLSRGAQLQFRFSQPVVVSESFYMGNVGNDGGPGGDQGSDMLATQATI